MTADATGGTSELHTALGVSQVDDFDRVYVQRGSRVGRYVLAHWAECREFSDFVERPLDAAHGRGHGQSSCLLVPRSTLLRAMRQMNAAIAADAAAEKAQLDARRRLDMARSAILSSAADEDAAAEFATRMDAEARANDASARRASSLRALAFPSAATAAAGTPWRYVGQTMTVPGSGALAEMLRTHWNEMRTPTIDPPTFAELPRVGNTLEMSLSAYGRVTALWRRAHIVAVEVNVPRPRSPPRAARSSGALDERLDVEASDDATSCCACLVHVRCVVFMPCRHMCMCATCANRLRFTAAPALAHCPKCRANVDDAIMVFL